VEYCAGVGRFETKFVVSLQLDEKGSEAAAATAVVMCGGCAPARTAQLLFTADHPFLLALVRNSRHVLFLGRYVVPA
jgi:serine protease inhibitor